jgi:hypothetical protein
MYFNYNVAPGRITIVKWSSEYLIGFSVVFAPNENNEIVSDKVIIQAKQELYGWCVNGSMVSYCGLHNVTNPIMLDGMNALSLPKIKKLQKLFEPSFQGERFVFIAECGLHSEPELLFQCEMKPLVIQRGMYNVERPVTPFKPK